MNPVTLPQALMPRRLRQIRCLVMLATVLVTCAAADAVTPATATGIPALQDIRDIRPPFHISQQWLWCVGVLGACVLAGLAVAAWRWQSSRGRARRQAAHELALARLREAQALMLPWLARDFCITVSDIIRGYIEQRFEIRAAHLTTPEFLRDCLTEADGLLQPHRETLDVFLRHCDLAKFARWVLTVPEMQEMLAGAVDFVTETAHPLLAEPAPMPPPAFTPEASRS